MTDMQDKYRERWNDRRKRAYNWKKLIIMCLLLAAILIAINRMNDIKVPQDKPAAEAIRVQDSDSIAAQQTVPIIPEAKETK